MAKNRELLEWLGLTAADLLVYLCFAAIGAMFLVRDAFVDLVLAVVGVAAALVACRLGMPRDPNVSGFTNAVKRYGYPLCAVLAVAAVIVHYVWFDE